MKKFLLIFAMLAISFVSVSAQCKCDCKVMDESYVSADMGVNHQAIEVVNIVSDQAVDEIVNDVSKITQFNSDHSVSIAIREVSDTEITFTLLNITADEPVAWNHDVRGNQLKFLMASQKTPVQLRL